MAMFNGESIPDLSPAQGLDFYDGSNILILLMYSKK